MKSFVTITALTAILLFPDMASSQTLDLRPTTGKFRNCMVDLSSCMPSDACLPKTQCPPPIDCNAKSSVTNCRKRIKGLFGHSIKLTDPTCQARLSASRSACERDQTRALEDCRIQRETETTDCLARQSNGRDACEKALKAEGQQCLARKEREISQSRQQITAISTVFQASSAVRAEPLGARVRTALGPVVQGNSLGELRLIQTKIFGSLSALFSSRTKYLNETVIRDIPYPDASGLSAAGNLLFVPDDREEYPIRDVLRAIAIADAYQRLGIDGFVQTYILERNIIDNYIAERVESACAKQTDCERLIDLDPN